MISQLLREKAIGLGLAALAIVAGLWAIYRFGPRPEKAVTRQASADQPVSTPASNQKSESQALGPDLFSALFKAATSEVASGRAGEPPANYLESLEAVYRRRGYRRFDPAAVGGGDRQSLETLRSRALNQMKGKVYWLAESEGVSTIAACGEDADPTAEAANTETSNVQKRIYLTTVSPSEGGGSQWTTYRYLADSSKLKAFNDQLQSGADLPGQDPLGVPRPSGLRRLVSVAQPGNQGVGRQSVAEAGQSSIQSSLMVVYQTSQRAEPLTEWYMKEMPMAGWSLNQPAGQSKEKVQGA